MSKDGPRGADRRTVAGAPAGAAEVLPTRGIAFAFEAIVALGPAQTPGVTPLKPTT